MANVKLANFVDLEKSVDGTISVADVRAMEVDAMVDTGATTLVITEAVAKALGVREIRRTRVRYADGRVGAVSVVGPIYLEVLGRSMAADAVVEPSAQTVLLGQIPLEELDLVVDPKSREVRVNPMSPDMSLLDLMQARSSADESTPAARST